MHSEINLDDAFFDSGEFYLDKETIKLVFMNIKKRWKKNPQSRLKNMEFGAAMATLEGSIYFIDETVLNFIWSSILEGVFELMKINAECKGAKENEQMEKLYSITMQKLKDGKLFQD